MSSPEKPPGPDAAPANPLAATELAGAESADPAKGATTLPSPNSGPRLPQQGGEVLGNRYEVLAELGRGGEGVVYRVRDLKAQATVALKVLQRGHGSLELLQRFRRELQMARKVTHPNVVRIHDLVELPGGLGLAMELVEGESLEARMTRGKLGRGEIAGIALDLARALAAAHAAGVTHRDLKPGNVLVRARDGRAMIADFGISRLHEAPAAAPSPEGPDAAPLQLTREGVLIGTPLYMAPEQLEGRTDIGPPADVYAFGMVLYEAASGDLPHVAETIEALRSARLAAPVAPLHGVRPDLPRGLCAVVDRALARDPKDRFASGVELLAALETASRPAARWWPVWAALALALVGGIGTVLVLGRSRAKAAPENPAALPSVASTPPLSMRTSNVRRLTFGDSCEEFPSFTPDGKTVLYDETVGKTSSIFALDLTPGAVPVQLTHATGWDMAAIVSPRGDRFAFLRAGGVEGTATFVAPFDGSAPPRQLARGRVRPSWTRDGKAVWLEGPSGLSAYDAGSGAIVRTVSESSRFPATNVVELADGALLVARPEVSGGAFDTTEIDVLPFGGGTRHLLTASIDEVLAVTPDQQHALVSRFMSTSHELVAVPLDGSPTISLASTGIAARKGLVLSADGKRVAWSVCEPTTQMVRVDTRGALTLPAKTGPMSGVASLAAVSGTTDVVVASDRSGSPEPWIVSVTDESPPRRIAMSGLPVRAVAVSGDGSSLAVSGSDGIYVGPLRGQSEVRRVTTDGTDDLPVFERGDRRVLFVRRGTDGSQIMAVPVDGSAPPALLLGPGSDSPATSPASDRVLYLASSSGDGVVPTLYDPRSGARRPLFRRGAAGTYSAPVLSPDGRRAALIRGATEIVEVDVETGAIRRTLRTPANDLLHALTYASGDILAIRVPFQGNVWVADVSP